MKHVNKKRIIAVFALVAMLLMTSCGNSNTDTAKTNAMAEADQKVAEAVKNKEVGFAKGKDISLTIGKGSDSNVTDFETNKFTLWLEEQTGLDLKFNIMADGTEKAKIMLAANDSTMPEVFMGIQFGDDILTKYGVEGENIFVPLDDYIDEYGNYIKIAMEESLCDVEKYLLSADGHRYFMPYITEQQGNVYSGKAWINKVWLDKLGLEVPKTTEDLRNVLKAFKTQDPNGNGKADELGFTGSKDGYRQTPYHFLINSFIYDDQKNYYVVDDNGKLSLAYMQPEFQDALRYINSLVDEGLFDVESFSMDNASLKSVAQMEDNIIGVYTSGSPDNVFSVTPERMLDYVALPPLEGPDGVAWAYKQPIDARVNGTITKYCKNPLAAFALMDFMLSKDASIFARYGEEGTDWRPATEDDVCLFENIGVEAEIVPILQFGVPQNSHWQATNPQFRYAAISDGMAWNGNPLDGEKVKADAITAYYGKGPDKIVEKQLFEAEEYEEYAELFATIDAFVKQNVASFITGEKDIDKDWDAFQQELKNYGVDRYLELSQIGYDRFEEGRAR